MGIIHYSEESLKFQSDRFFKHLIMLYDELLSIKDNTERVESPIWRAMEETIFDFVKIKVTIQQDSFGPAVELPSVDRNNILINAWRRPYMSSSDGIKMIQDAKGAAVGSVDRSTGSVGGIFSKVNHNLHMNEELFNGVSAIRFTAEEFAAITLHELGHIWTFYNYLGLTATTNHVLNGMAVALGNEPSPERRELILRMAADELKLKNIDTKELAKSTNQKVIEYVFLSSAVRDTRSELGTPYYDLSQAEQLADEYAARFQAHVALTTALDKIERSQPLNMSYRSWTGYFMMEAVKLAGVIISITAAVTSTSGVGIMFVSGAYRALLVLLFIADGRGDGEYDRPGARFKRIRNQIVEQLKDKKLTKNQVAQLREDILEIDNITKMVEDKDQLTNILWDFLSPASRRAQAEVKLQRDLEDIANNEIFVHAAHLKQLT